jgi:hypothetical protein
MSTPFICELLTHMDVRPTPLFQGDVDSNDSDVGDANLDDNAPIAEETMPTQAPEASVCCQRRDTGECIRRRRWGSAAGRSASRPRGHHSVVAAEGARWEVLGGNGGNAPQVASRYGHRREHRLDTARQGSGYGCTGSEKGNALQVAASCVWRAPFSC